MNNIFVMGYRVFGQDASNSFHTFTWLMNGVSFRLNGSNIGGFWAVSKFGEQSAQINAVSLIAVTTDLT